MFELKCIEEVLINNVNCFLANPRNIQEWVNLIIKISKNKNLNNTISTKAYLSFKSKYSWDIRVEKLLKFLDEKKIKITVVGLGYVGLPLALEFGKKYSTIGFDIDKSRIEELNKKKDRNNEFTKKDFKYSKKLKFKNNLNEDNDSSIYIVTVPTPVTKKNKPDLSLVESACRLIGMKIKKNDIVVFESTVYPGATDDVFVPIVEKISGLKEKRFFMVIHQKE